MGLRGRLSRLRLPGAPPDEPATVVEPSRHRGERAHDGAVSDEAFGTDDRDERPRFGSADDDAEEERSATSRWGRVLPDDPTLDEIAPVRRRFVADDDPSFDDVGLDDLPEPVRPEPVRAEAALPSLEGKVLLDELRARMGRVLERSPIERGKPPRDVDFPELPFVAEETPHGTLHARARRLSAAHRVGNVHVHPAEVARADVLALLALDASLAGCDPSRALYLDTETTGLSGGTGTVAFLVGLAYWDGGWVTEQLLVRQLGEEAPMLARVSERIAASSMLVTFNGKSFDMPLLRTRFVLAGLPLPEEPPHLDLVHVARRLHKARNVPCKLTKLEEHVLGFVRHDDVPSGEVAGHYLHFLRTGDTRGLVGVVEHNAWDVDAMIALVSLYGEPLAETRLEPKDLVGVAETLRRSQRLDDALLFADRAVTEGAGAEALRARAMLKKARGEKEAALVDFEALSAQVDCPRTRLELAKLYEHVKKAPARALAVLERGTVERADLAQKRRARLEKKAAKEAPPKDDGPLFRLK